MAPIPAPDSALGSRPRLYSEELPADAGLAGLCDEASPASPESSAQLCLPALPGLTVAVLDTKYEDFERRMKQADCQARNIRMSALKDLVVEMNCSWLLFGYDGKEDRFPGGFGNNGEWISGLPLLRVRVPGPAGAEPERGRAGAGPEPGPSRGRVGVGAGAGTGPGPSRSGGRGRHEAGLPYYPIVL